MRLNRNLRIGLALIGAAFLVWAVSRLFNRGSSSRPPVVADAGSSAQTTPAVQPVALAVGSQQYRAIEDIPERSIITRDMFVAEPLPRGASQDVYVTDMATQAQGYITRNRISRDTVLQKSNLIGHISDVGVVGALRPGLRAMVVPIPNKPTLHDLVHVGDYVDVIAAFDQQEARTVVQNVRVLAVDVFGKDFPQVRIAARGDYKAEARGIGTANPGSPVMTNTNASGTQKIGQGDGAPASSAPAAPAATPVATPTPAPNGQPPAKPEPAITLEVTPDQATALSLSQASNAPLDFILRPRPTEAVLPETRVAASIKSRLAPYAQSVKNRAANSGRTTNANNASRGNASRGSGSRSSGSRLVDRRPAPNFGDVYSGPAPTPLPPFPPNMGKQFDTPPAKTTYKIPVYAEGKLVKEYDVDTPGS